MVFHERSETIPQTVEPTMASPRISFSNDFVIGTSFVNGADNPERRKAHASDTDFEFFLGNSNTSMMTADELFSEGRLLPCWRALEKITFKSKEEDEKEEEKKMGERRSAMSNVNWFVDDDPSPRPPKCTVLWKELLKLKKQPPPSSSSASTTKTVDSESKDEKKHVKRIKKGLERTRSASVRIRPVVHVPICTQGKNNTLPVLFSLKK